MLSRRQLLLLAVISLSITKHQCKKVQFIFGDSLSEVGNNNHLTRSLAQASLPWYGVDFGDGLPNGRYTNGRTVADILGDHIGLPRPPAYMDPSLSEDVILNKGVNFASGGGGILNETGGFFRFSLHKQIDLFQGVKRLIVNYAGEDNARKFFESASYVVAIGSNDLINNYLVPFYKDSWSFNDQSFIDHLMSTLRDHLSLLHELGAREVLVFGLGPVGCIPLQRVFSMSGGCQKRTNDLAIRFNQGVQKMSEFMSAQLANASFQYADAYDVINDIVTNPSKYGFSNSDTPCCSFGEIRPSLTCIPTSTLCYDRRKYVFWDEYHPSDRANELIAKELMQKLGFSPAYGSGVNP